MIRKDRIQKAFGARVRELRTAAGFSQEAFAEHAGLDRSYMGAVERGERNVTLLSIFRISVALRVEAAELMRGVRP